MVVGAAMVAALVLALKTVRRGDIAGHRAWMMRAYALGLGAGTQVVVMLPWALAFGMPTHLPYELLMTLAWLINVVVAELIIRRPAFQGATKRVTWDPRAGGGGDAAEPTRPADAEVWATDPTRRRAAAVAGPGASMATRQRPPCLQRHR